MAELLSWRLLQMKVSTGALEWASALSFPLLGTFSLMPFAFLCVFEQPGP